MTRPWRILRALLLCRPAARLPMDEWRLVRRAILIRDNDRCRCRRWLGWGPECGRAEVDMHVDHCVPVAWGGSSDGSNLRAACQACNLRKGSRPPLGWLLARIGRVVPVYGALAWLTMSEVAVIRDLRTTPAVADAVVYNLWTTPVTPRWAVVAPGGQLVAAFSDRTAAERAAAGWNAAGGAGELGIAEIPVRP